ncbi:hypothetical protein KKB43_03915 [Patescibacteria group bacterium]|nr:hypothetical protein [Patescibacteria group bacterium]
MSGAPTSLARKIAAAKKEAAKARAGKNSFHSTIFLFARPSVQFRFCRASRGNQSGVLFKKCSSGVV